MSGIAYYIGSLADDAEEVDLSSFELIEDLDAATWKKLKNNETMKRLKLPPSLLTIRKSAFVWHSQLIHVTLPSSLRSIERYAFHDCRSLAINDFKLPDTLEELGYGAFQCCSGLTGKLSTHIAQRFSFSRCTGLSELDLDDCKDVAPSCFAYCTGLTKLKLPSSLQRIGNHAFCYCTGLTGPLVIPPFVSFIHPHAFEGCTGLINVEQTVEEHSTSFKSWKARGNVLMTLIRFDEEYRCVVEQNGGTLRSDLSNSFLSDYSKDAQLIYKATAHVDGTDNLANGICRLVVSFLPMKIKYYGTMLSNDEVDTLREEDNADSDEFPEADAFDTRVYV
jgi:hypothetical protein